ncbi:MAG: glycosyltransferase family 4 protein [Bacteroidetes bacterium]|nr:glycosyltransferase family 4 protein [Bacteroidota bacterium]
MKRIKILHAIRQADFGGGETHLRYLVDNLNPKKFESVILTFSGGRLLKEFENKGLRTYNLNSRIPFNLSLRKRINSIISNEKIDLIHAHGTKGASNVVFSTKASRIPLIYTVHGWSFHRGINQINYRIRKRIEKYICENSTHVICVSKANCEDAPLTNKNNLKLIYNGIDTEKYSPKNKKKMRTEFGIDDRTFMIGFLVRLTYQKNPITVLRAFQILTEKFHDIKLMIVGEGDLKNEVISFIQKNNLSDRVIILPYRSDIDDLLNVIDCYVLPSIWEGLPYGLLEAMSMGVPSIATNVDGIPEVIDNNINGILVDPMDYNMIAESIERIKTDNNFYSYISKNARHTIVSKFDLKQMINKTEDLYTKVKLNHK